MDRARHLSEDADDISVVGVDGGFTDQVAATVVVALKESGLADGRPLAALVPSAQDVGHLDVAILLEIDIAGVAAAIHIFGQVNQLVFPDDERIALGAMTIGEKILVEFPLGIEIILSLSDGNFV